MRYLNAFNQPMTISEFLTHTFLGNAIVFLLVEGVIVLSMYLMHIYPLGWWSL